jgi:hypothetical protein
MKGIKSRLTLKFLTSVDLVKIDDRVYPAFYAMCARELIISAE